MKETLNVMRNLVTIGIFVRKPEILLKALSWLLRCRERFCWLQGWPDTVLPWVGYPSSFLQHADGSFWGRQVPNHGLWAWNFKVTRPVFQLCHSAALIHLLPEQCSDVLLPSPARQPPTVAMTALTLTIMFPLRIFKADRDSHLTKPRIFEMNFWEVWEAAAPTIVVLHCPPEGTPWQMLTIHEWQGDQGTVWQ